MSDEKSAGARGSEGAIDLAEIARDAEESRGDYFGVSLDVDDVLAPFTDSTESASGVRSDD